MTVCCSCVALSSVVGDVTVTVAVVAGVAVGVGMATLGRTASMGVSGVAVAHDDMMQRARRERLYGHGW